MTDFARKHRQVKFFGIWAEETAESFGRVEAFDVLIDAVERCVDEDMRCEDVYAALNFLEKSSTRPWIFQQFRLALSHPHPVERYQILRLRLKSIKALLNGP